MGFLRNILYEQVVKETISSLYEVNTVDKYEFKLRSEEIEKLMDMQDYKSAVRLADTIDWRRVKSVATLVRIAELYRYNKRFEESRDLLELAYDRNPSSRNVVYGLCEISLEFGDIVAAIEYFKEFAKLAPNDSEVYILRYRIYEAQNVGFEDRIELLEELKKKDRMEEWEYQLAYLYHRAGFATKCVEECDEIILWFGEGPYVIKAMELKMLHEPLTPAQQEKYDRRNESKIEEAARAAKAKSEQNPVLEDDDFRVKTIDMSKYNTINLQAELAENLKEFIEEEPTPVVMGNEQNSNPVEIRGDKEVFHNTIPADVNEIFFADKTEDLRYVVPTPVAQSADTPELATFKENYSKDIVAAAGRDVQEVLLEEPPVVSMDSHLTQQSDGQIGLVNIEEKQVERQITGQMSIQDILEGWERMKVENTQRFRDEVRKQLLEQTGEMFAEFDVNTKSGMLSSLESPEQIDNVLGTVSPTVMKGLDASAVTPIAQAVPDDTIATATVVGVLSEQDTAFAQIVPQAATEESAVTAKSEEHVAEEPAAEVVEQAAEEPVAEVVEHAAEEPAAEVVEHVAEEPAAEVMEHVDEEPAAEPVEQAAEEPVAEPVEISETPVAAVTQSEPDVMSDFSQNGRYYGAVTGTIPGNIWKEVENSIADDVMANEVESMIEEDVILPTLAEAEPIREVQAVNDMTPEEKELFSPFLYSKRMKFQLIETLESITLAAYSGNVLISSEDDESAVRLAKQIVRFVQAGDDNFSGKVAKITAESLNKKDIFETFSKLENGALLIEHASNMSKETIKNLLQSLNQEHTGILVILMDKKPGIQKLVDKIPYVKEFFNGRVDIIPMSMEMLITFAIKYAREQGYTIDDMGHLALSKRVSDMRRGNHTVTIDEVKAIVNEAIRRSGKKKLFGKARKDEDGYTILKEKDFE